jgi:hypothetical protein
MSVSLQAQAGVALTAGFGGVANNAKALDSSYLVSNTSTGSTFTVLSVEFPAAWRVDSVGLDAAGWADGGGGVATWVVATAAGPGRRWPAFRCRARRRTMRLRRSTNC